MIHSALDLGAFDGWRFLETLLGGLSSAAIFFLTLYKYHKADRKALTDAAEKVEEQNNIRHTENRNAIRELAVELRYKPLHVHRERNGPLTVNGIDYGPSKDRDK